ncbi:MAG: ABC transporter permease [Acidobacteria bacterium]|nr:ABC transporter permease [Acidobacteriota bacterium]
MTLTGRALVLAASLASITLIAPHVAPYDPAATFRDFRHAPPMPPRVTEGFAVYPIRLEDRLFERFAEDRSRTVALPWRRAGTSDPVFLLGTDASSRDVLSRLLVAARVSLGLALVSVLGATLLGTTLGALSAYAGGWTDQIVSRAGEAILVLPVMYLAIVLRASLPLVLAPSLVFVLLAAIFTLLSWPIVARGVRAIVERERSREYVTAAQSLGGSTRHILLRHLAPAVAGHVAVQASLLLPAFILAEAALSYVGLGFPSGYPTWGTMLHEVDINELSRFPWTLAPAGAIFLVTLVTNLMLQSRDARQPTPFT